MTKLKNGSRSAKRNSWIVDIVHVVLAVVVAATVQVHMGIRILIGIISLISMVATIFLTTRAARLHIRHRLFTLRLLFLTRLHRRRSLDHRLTSLACAVTSVKNLVICLGSVPTSL